MGSIEMTSTTPIRSDFSVDVAKISEAGITPNTIRVNTVVEKLTKASARWWKVGAAEHREMLLAGKTPFPPPVLLPEAKETTIPSREAERDIPIRIFTPSNGEPSKGIFLHIHGGGFVLFSHQSQDAFLKLHADNCQLTVITVGYRLAPEHPYPAGPEDCFDVAEWLVDNGEKEYGAPLKFIGGESAGGTLTALTAFELIRTRPKHELKGLSMWYGWYDLTLTLPGALSFTRDLIINIEDLHQFNNAYVPNTSVEERMNPRISPMYENLSDLAASTPSKRLPPALFQCGTQDNFVEENIIMNTRWLATQSDAILKIYPGGCHGFGPMPGLKIADDARNLAFQWIRERI